MTMFYDILFEKMPVFFSFSCLEIDSPTPKF